MLHHGVGLGLGHELRIHAVAGKGGFPLLALLLLAHGGPHVGDDHVGVLGGLERGIGQLKLVPVPGGELQNLLGRAVALGAGHGHAHAHLQAAHDQGVHHVVAVADKAQLQPLQGALVLPDGHQVRQHLAGVAEVRQAVDDGHAAVLGQSLHLVLAEGADHDAVHIPGEHPGCVLDRLAPADLGAFRPQHHGVAAQLVDAHLKADAGAGGGFLENHAQALALEVGVGDAVLCLVFQLVGQVQDVQNLLAGEV